jgi:hypothetical protein
VAEAPGQAAAQAEAGAVPGTGNGAGGVDGRPTATDLVRGKELAQQTIALSFYNMRAAISQLESETPGAIKAMFLSVIPDELAEQGAALVDLIPLPGLAVLVSVFGSGFHQGYSTANAHAAQGRNLHHEMQAAAARKAPPATTPAAQARP